jgi:CRP/FNR family transcriptional regulator, cyclic AMP receptor protein
MIRIKSVLSDCPILTGFPPEAMDELAEIGRVRTFSGGEQIYEQGATSTTLCVIAKGVVRISSINAAGREATLIMFSAGAWFGDAVFSPGMPRVYGATAHEPVTLVELPGDGFRALMKRYPQCYPVVLDMVSRRLWAAMSIIEDDALRNIPTRIGRRLLFLAQIQGDGEESTRPVTIRITREHMANMMGMTRQGVHNWIKEFEREGLISLAYGSITLTNPAALKAYLGRVDTG